MSVRRDLAALDPPLAQWHTHEMRGLVVVAVAAGCWTDSSSPPAATPAPVSLGSVHGSLGPAEAPPAPAPGAPTFDMTGLAIGGAPAPAPTHPPTVQVGAPAGPAAIPPEVIRRVVHEHLRELSACYEHALETDPKLAGAVRVRFTIGPDGRVVQSHGKGLQANVDDCIATVISTVRFPLPANGGSVVVEYPFDLSP